MIREAIATGETVELAKEAACRELGVESYDAEFEILEMPTKKTFGLFGGSPAKVRVFIKSSPAEAAAKYLKEILNHMGLPAVEIQITEEENGAQLSLSGDDIGFIIGHRGETLDALQYLTGLVANHIDNSYYRITIDIGNYREKRKETLEILGKKIAAKAIKTGRNSSLEPMNPYERRIIHTAVQTIEGAKSWSEGEDLARHVVIGPEAGERPAPRRNNYGKGRRPYNDKPRTGFNNRPPKSAPSVGSGPSASPAPVRQPVQKEAPKNEGKALLYGRIDVKK
ncbi:RNA-binding cell elongation regulator Jag/EloR [Caproiciproducens faecalis]|uniref:RNA-binding protein KhpB n=1 Tax=Caproiciproducens faecalis TaxID=2820301 RepID=A0ABS7DNM3_9FIRM|nr:protein jag [Caproiciproducens faecalis]